MTDPGHTPDLWSVLASRRMCRDYLDRAVDADVLDRVLAAAFRAPSAGNTAALDLVVLTGDDVDRYWDTSLPEPRRSSFPWPGLLRAPVLVLPYVDPDAYVQRYAEPDKARTGLGVDQGDWSVPYWWVDGGAAVMALLLAAEAADLGALFFGQFDHERAIGGTFGVPGSRRALGTVALGHPGGRDRPSASARRPRESIGSRVHRGGWASG